jgi:hypothetical protein
VLFSVLIECGNDAARSLPRLVDCGRGRSGILLFPAGSILFRFRYIYVLNRLGDSLRKSNPFATRLGAHIGNRYYVRQNRGKHAS